MILILEGDYDRDVFKAGITWRSDLVPSLATWTSPEVYAEEVVLADLREKIEALRDVHERKIARIGGQEYMLPEQKRTYDERTIRAVLALIDREQL